MRIRKGFVKKIKSVYFMAAIVIAAGTFAAPVAAEIDLTVVYMPLANNALSFEDENKQIAGFNVELMKKIAEMESDLNIVTGEPAYELLGAIASVNKNTVGMFLPISKWDYVPEADVYKRHPYLNSVPVILSVKNLPNPDNPLSKINGLEDLKGKNVVCSEKIMDEMMENLDAYNSTHTDDPLEFNLVEGSVSLFDFDSVLYSLFPCDAVAAIVPLEQAVSLAKNDPEHFNIIEIPDADQIYVYSYWISFWVDNPDYNPEGVAAMTTVTEKIDADLDILIADGTYAKLCAEYLGVDMTPYYDVAANKREDDASGSEQAEGTDTVDGSAVQDEEGTAEETAEAVYTDQETVMKVQEALNAAGYDCGTPDGIAGNNTNQAIINYKAANGLDESSDITDALLNALGIN